ncbi:MAG TPA: hypothetical protein VMD55_08995 [Terracidiphilus sp.]|nr:hypothetical protein [Terracidiphilus sp.]
MIPSIAVLRVENTRWRSPQLWIPLFLLWIPVLLLSPLIFLVLVGLSLANGISPWRVFRIFWDIVSGLPGTHVHVRADGNTVQVRVL